MDAEKRLETALAERHLADPRPALRDRLRMLRESDPSAFEQARVRFETMVSQGDGGGDVLEPWIEYGRMLGELTGEGRLMRIDETGRAALHEDRGVAAALLLHVPRDVADPALVVLAPARPTAAQQATLDLLVNRRLSL